MKKLYSGYKWYGVFSSDKAANNNQKDNKRIQSYNKTLKFIRDKKIQIQNLLKK